MKTLSIKCIALGAALATMIAASSGHAHGQPLKLSGKSVMIFPILLGKPSDDDDSWKYAIEIAEGLGVKLERLGMLPSISPRYPEPIMEEENLASAVKQLLAFMNRRKAETDYLLFARFEGNQSGGKFVARARAVLTDAEGRVVWSQEPGEFSEAGNIWPIALSRQLAHTLLTLFDLKEPNRQTKPGPLETRLRQRHAQNARPASITCPPGPGARGNTKTSNALPHVPYDHRLSMEHPMR